MTIYNKGRRKEYAIISKLKNEGFDIVQRTAGSHSPVDIIAINSKDKIIKLVQSKRTLNKAMSFINERLKNKLLEDNKDLNGLFNVSFNVY